ncbi:LPS export ABC transporter periplasmic protein LptC [Rubrivivax gelatinosus]|uniref:LPS export ABC transporter periplasmic protein LptC n=1 Tax=Rubrivivax gelatinosus TaxID=28068 RepID=UPI001907BEDF|nr:LPS export ABC transporter periplasmic protein LptC [Rubrivivax gelatinosus]MBK1616365.1 LPS export ABC transporter periplasmic protein LptC [Rubrivivax gelatinosus]
MSVELHLPDLPEVPISLGAAAQPPLDTPPAPRMPWSLRLREALSAYLPLLLMALLALATWWLVKNTPSAPRTPDQAVVRQDPDYTMTGFAVERFEATGRLKVRIEGEQMRHYPATDQIEIDRVHIRAIAPDGRVTLADARRALANGDASEIQLLGAAHVTTTDERGQKVQMAGEFLHAFLVTERVRSHLPVRVTSADGSVFEATGLEYDHGLRKLELRGPMRGTFAPRSSK